MDVVALSPVLAERLFWRRDPERWALTIVVKATFDLVPGEVRPSTQPLPLNTADVHEGGSASRGLIAPSDLVPFKARADLVLVGNAYAPHGRPVSTLTARFAVGAVDKSIVVLGNRLVSARGVGPALPFAKMPITYERASGGPGTSNPVGMPRGERLPNLEPVGWSASPRMEMSGAAVPPPPIAFGPIAPSWPERAAKHRAWRMDEPLPEDFDPAFFNAAPTDQQTAFLRGDETIVLEHLHPDHAMLTTRLPGIVPRAFADRWRGAPEPIEMLADTLWIDTDRRKLALVWRGETTMASRDEAGRVMLAMTKAREPLGYEQMLELHRALSATGPHTLTLDDDEAEAEDAEDEMRSTNAVPAARLPDAMLSAERSRAPSDPRSRALPSFDDEDDMPPLPSLPSFDDEDSADDLPSRIDPLGTSTRAFPLAGGAVIPDAAPVWLATPSRQGVSMPRPATVVSHVSPPREGSPPMPPPDLVWDSPPDAAEPLTLPPPRPAAFGPSGDTASVPAAKPATMRPPPLPGDGTRTGPLPVVSAVEPASPWAAGLSPENTAPPLAPMPSAVLLRPEPPTHEPTVPRRAPKRKVEPKPASDAVDLVWFDPDAVARIGSRFRELVDELDMEPLDPAHDLPVDDPAAARDRHHVFGVLTRAAVTDARGVPAAVRGATDTHGRFTPPLVVVEGDLAFGLEERAVLETTAACAKPLAKDNKRLQDVLASVEELLATPLLTGAVGASESLLREVLAAVPGSKRALPVKVLEEHVERLLLSKRTYQIRTVLGGPQIRAALSPGQGALALISYLPEPVGPKLPLSLRFRARVIAEIHPSPDPQEPAPLALRVVALGRVVPLPGR